MWLPAIVYWRCLPWRRLSFCSTSSGDSANEGTSAFQVFLSVVWLHPLLLLFEAVLYNGENCSHTRTACSSIMLADERQTHPYRFWTSTASSVEISRQDKKVSSRQLTCSGCLWQASSVCVSMLNPIHRSSRSHARPCQWLIVNTISWAQELKLYTVPWRGEPYSTSLGICKFSMLQHVTDHSDDSTDAWLFNQTKRTNMLKGKKGLLFADKSIIHKNGLMLNPSKFLPDAATAFCEDMKQIIQTKRLKTRRQLHFD